MRAATTAVLLVLCTACAQAPERRNWFGDPFFQATSGLPRCPAPLGPLLTYEEQRHEAHYRAERGTSCWLAGRCADSNAYRGDQALGERVRVALRDLDGIADTSVWVTVQRKWVFLEGCVARPQQAALLERAAREVEGVETVVPALDVGIGHPPRYPVAEWPALPSRRCGPARNISTASRSACSSRAACSGAASRC
jgi:hypothetical protein